MKQVEDQDNEDESDDLDIEAEMDKAQGAQKTKAQGQAQAGKQSTAASAASETFGVIHQPEKIAIVDTRTGEIISEGYDKDSIAIALGQARILNILENISIASGAQ